MKKVICFLLILSTIIPYKVSALEVSATSAILMDMDTGRVLYEKNIDQQRLIASITKIMTAVLAIESNKLDEVVTVGEEVLTMYGSNIYIELNEKMTLRNLVYGLLLRSGNDAAIVIATFIGKTEENFVKMMNEKAKEIGMKNTIFQNSHGLDEVTQNYSTAKDMAILSSYANKLEDYRTISATEKHIVKSENKTYLWYNRNKLLKSYEFATGGKTGYTPSAGRTLVTTASKGNLNLTAVTLNDPNEYVSHTNMYNYGFSKYKKYKIIDQYNFYIDQNFYQDKVYIKQSFSYPLLESETNKVKTIVKLEKLRNYENNSKVGYIEISLNNECIKTIPVYVKVKEKQTSFLKKILNFFKMEIFYK